MRHLKSKKKIAMVSAGLICCLALEQPLAVSAAEGTSILQTAGVASFLETTRTMEEYVEIAQQAQGASWGYTNIGIANVESGNLNVRESPSTDSKLVGKMPKDSACEVLEMLDGWAHITSGEVEGYVSTEFLFTGPEAKIAADDLARTVVLVKDRKSVV